MLNNLIICIPTYKRKWFNALSCITDNPDLTFHLCVRKEEYENNFYDEPQFKHENIKFILLENVNDIGETREAILQYAIKNNYKYCMQMDDTQFGLHDLSNKYDFLIDILKTCLSRFENDIYKDNAFCFNFGRKSYNVAENETYFISQMCQTFILNCEICQKFDLHFRSLKKYGCEDMLFCTEAYFKKLIMMSDKRFIRIGTKPCIKKSGGNHNENYMNFYIKMYEDYEKTIQTLENYDSNILIKKPSVTIPGTFYYKFNVNYAYKNLIKLS